MYFLVYLAVLFAVASNKSCCCESGAGARPAGGLADGRGESYQPSSPLIIIIILIVIIILNTKYYILHTTLTTNY